MPVVLHVGVLVLYWSSNFQFSLGEAKLRWLLNLNVKFVDYHNVNCLSFVYIIPVSQITLTCCNS